MALDTNRGYCRLMFGSIIILSSFVMFLMVFTTPAQNISNEWNFEGRAMEALPVNLKLSSKNSNVTRIPRMFHQTWKDRDIPSKWEYAFNMCKTQGHTFNRTLWTDKMIRDFISREYPHFLKTFDSYPYDIQRVDAAKYILVYHFGGIYLDLDIRCRRKLESLLRDLEQISPGYAVVLAPAEPFGVTSDFLIATPKHPFMHHVVTQLSKNAGYNFLFPYLTVFFTTGPLFLTRCYKSYAELDDIMLIPPKLYNGEYFRHLPGGSWHSWDGKLAWYLYNEVGFTFIAEIFMILFLFVVLYRKCGKRFLKTRQWK